jgi:HlyD family secretion protein
MKLQRIIYWTIIGILGFVLSFATYRYFFAPKKQVWYTTEKPARKNISQIIRSTGILEAEDTLKIGSIVPGVINKMLVEENDMVKKGALLAIIDDGKGDTEVRSTEGNLRQAKSDLAYMKNYYTRQKALYEAKQLSQDSFEKVSRDYEDAQALVYSRQADYDKAKLTFDNKRILSPDAGLVIAKIAAEGETVTLSSPATIIYTIAKDIRRMKVKLEIDENRIGEVKVGQTATLTFDTYPYKKFSGKIKDVSNAPILKNAAVSYYANFILDNAELLLRPGMTVNARILVAEKENVLAIPGHELAMNSSLLEQIAKIINFEFKPMDKTKKQKLEKKGAYKTVWIKEGNAFIERPVELGINDNAFFEVVSGLTGDENIINDIKEADTLQQLYSQLFGKGL